MSEVIEMPTHSTGNGCYSFEPISKHILAQCVSLSHHPCHLNRGLLTIFELRGEHGYEQMFTKWLPKHSQGCH